MAKAAQCDWLIAGKYPCSKSEGHLSVCVTKIFFNPKTLEGKAQAELFDQGEKDLT